MSLRSAWLISQAHKTLFTISLTGLHIVRLEQEKTGARVHAISSVKVDMEATGLTFAAKPGSWR